MGIRALFPVLFVSVCLFNTFAGDAPKPADTPKPADAPKPAADDAEKAKITGLKLYLKLDEKDGAKAANSAEKGVEVVDFAEIFID